MSKLLRGTAAAFLVAILVLPSMPFQVVKGSETDTIVENFEGDDTIAKARGAKVEIVKGAGVDASKALLVSERTQNWHGVDFSGSDYAGTTIKVSAQVKSINASMKISLQYDDSEGKTNYKTIATATTGSDEYVTISGEYNVPSGVTNIVIYFESEELNNFYVDNLKIVKQEKILSIQEELTPVKDHLAKETTIAGKAGVAIPAGALDDNVRMALVTKHFNSITAENEMKPDSILGKTANLDENRKLILDFTNADKIMDYILAYNTKHPNNLIKVRGHVLVWHSQTPAWFFKENYSSEGAYVSKSVMLERMDYYIKSVIEHYDGKGSKYAGIIYAWDVVNEQIDQGTIRMSDGNSGTSNWYQVFRGEDTYIKEAFRMANKYAPEDVKLFYNDYGETDSTKCTAICKLLQEIKAYDGARIDGMGMQAHYNMETPAIDSFEKAVRAYAAVVNEVQLTELDFQSSADYNGTNKEAEYTKQGYRYKAIFDQLYALDQEKGINITGITVWGTHDAASWLQSASFVGGGADGTRKQCPLLFDNEYQAKPAYYGIVDPSQLEPFTNNVIALYSADDNWAVAPKTTYKSNGTEVTFQTIWNADNIKVKVQVQDQDAAGKDRITVYVDAGNTKSDTADIKKYTLERSNAKVTEKGYEGIITIPLNGRKVGDEIGLDIAVTNNGTVLSWNDLKNTQEATSKYYGEVMMKPYADISYGTPAIDGALDKIWEKQSVFPLTVKTGSPAATAKVRAMWDEKYLYVFADITDPLMSKASKNTWEQDSLEIFLDQNNGKTSAYEEDDCQYRINFDNETSFNGTKCNAEHLISKTKTMDTGYVVEAAIQWTNVTPAIGTLIGVDFQLNDDNGSGSRSGSYNWYDEKGSGYANPSVFGTVSLKKAEGDSQNIGQTGSTGETGSIANPDSTGNSNISGNDGNSKENNNTGTDKKQNTDNNTVAETEKKTFTLIDAAKNSKVIKKLLKIQKSEGTFVTTTGKIASPGKVTVSIKNVKAGSRVYIYRVNETTGKLETIKEGFSNRVDKDGKVTFTLLEGGDYVVLTAKVNRKLVTTFSNQIKVTLAKSSVKAGKSIGIKIDLPAGLELTQKLSDKTSSKAVGAAIVSYKISDTKVAVVDRNGKVTAKKKGMVTITTTIRLYNNTTKIVKTNLKVN